VNEHEQHDLIEGYLKRLARALGDVPREAQRELLEDVRGHIQEAWKAAPEQSREALQSILERLGTPEALAGEERERLHLPAPAEGGSDWMAAITILLAAVVWPVGILLAWLLPRWSRHDKAIATAIPVGGLLLVWVLSYAVVPALQGRMALAVGEGVAQFGFWGAPLVAAVYLAWRQRPKRRWALVLGALGVGVVLLVVLLVTATWLPVRQGGLLLSSGHAEVTVEVQPLP